MESLYVYMNGNFVGEYIQHRSGAQEFIYDDNWISLNNAIPLSISLPLTDKIHRGQIVYNYFDNLLPDSHNIRNRIQTTYGINTNKPFDILSHIGRDCVGAIQLLSAKSDFSVKKIEGEVLNEKEISDELRNYKSSPLGMTKFTDFRISIAGAQEKTAFLWHNNSWLRPTGATPTTHIFKLPIGQIKHAGIDLSDSVDNEWLCLELMREFGIPVPHAIVQNFEDIKVLIVQRFDRKLSEDRSWIVRLPVEDMCQAHGISPSLKYENEGGPGISKILGLLKSSLTPSLDRKQFMKSIFLFWLLGAIDGHAKNFSVFLKQRGRFNLTPVYDVLSAYPLADKKQLALKKMKMAMAVSGRNKHYHWHEIIHRHWFEEAKKDEFPSSDLQEIIDETLAHIDSVISKISSRLPANFPDEVSTSIFEGMNKARAKFVR